MKRGVIAAPGLLPVREKPPVLSYGGQGGQTNATGIPEPESGAIGMPSFRNLIIINNKAVKVFTILADIFNCSDLSWCSAPCKAFRH